jgi:hypothetical protein
VQVAIMHHALSESEPAAAAAPAAMSKDEFLAGWLHNEQRRTDSSREVDRWRVRLIELEMDRIKAQTQLLRKQSDALGVLTPSGATNKRKASQDPPQERCVRSSGRLRASAAGVGASASAAAATDVDNPTVHF